MCGYLQIVGALSSPTNELDTGGAHRLFDAAVLYKNFVVIAGAGIYFGGAGWNIASMGTDYGGYWFVRQRGCNARRSSKYVADDELIKQMCGKTLLLALMSCRLM